MILGDMLNDDEAERGIRKPITFKGANQIATKEATHIHQRSIFSSAKRRCQPVLQNTEMPLCR